MKRERLQAYVKVETKEAIVKAAKEKEVSESHIAGKILDNAFSPVTVAKK